MIDLTPLLADLSSNQQMILMIVGLGVCVPTIIAVVGICAGTWAQVNRLRLDHALKQQMIDRGMGAEEIAVVLKGPDRVEQGVESPCASEVVVENCGEWQTALVLKRDGERYYVHFVGTEMSDNEWVTSDRVRFPATNGDHCGTPGDWLLAGGSALAAGWCGKARHSKPAPVDQEI
jgi:hypothetical protein